MANDAYLQIDSIKGESADQKHRDWIEVSNVLYAVHQPRAETVSTAGGGADKRDTGNPCGHALLHVGDSWYFHIAGRNNLPKHMSESGYQRYLKENGKKEIRRWIVKVPNPEVAHSKLLELVIQKWPWYVVYNNCASFVEVVLEAGGSKAGMYLNCPSLEPFA